MKQSKPLVRPSLNAGGIATSEEPGRSRQCSLLPAAKAPAITRQDYSGTRKMYRTHFAAQPNERSPNSLARIDLGWKRCLQVVNCTWETRWTTETCSYIVSVSALAGLITALLAHQNKPLSQ